MNIQILVYVALGLALLLMLWNIGLQIKISRLLKNQKRLFQGTKAKDLEKIILESKAKIIANEAEIKNLYDVTSKIDALAQKSLHNVGLIRFNPFRDIGGDQSFSAALLDSEKSGLVISSLYSREGVRVYAKSVLKGQSVKYPLSEEEKEVINLASKEKTATLSKKAIN